MNRRELLKGLMAGGIIVAGELWVPGAKAISIPSGRQFYGPSLFEILGNDIKYIGPEDKTVTMKQLYSWLAKNADQALSPMQSDDGCAVSLCDNYRIENPEHLVGGTLSQAAGDTHMRDLRELWSCNDTLGEADLFTDKVYFAQGESPRERYRELDNGHKGYR